MTLPESIDAGRAVYQRVRWRAWLMWIGVLLAPALLGAGIGLWWSFGERWDSDGPYYTGIALEAARNGHWWTLHQGELPYFNKPPLGFWVHAICAMIFGESDWALKLPAVVVFALGCAATAGLARALTHSRCSTTPHLIGLAAGVSLACLSEWHWRLPNFRLDALHALLCVLFLWAGVHVVRRPVFDWRLVVAGGIALGGALLTKQFYGLFAPMLLMLWAVWIGRFSRGMLWRLALMTGLGVLVAAPWYVSMVAVHHSAFIGKHIVEQSVKRATGELFDREPWWWYLGYLSGFRSRGPLGVEWSWPVLGLSLCGLVVVAYREGVTRLRGSTRPDTGDSQDNDAGRLGASWVVGWMVALSCFADKRSYYLLIVFPGCACLAAIALTSTVPRFTRSASSRALLALVILTGLAGVAIGAAAVTQRQDIRTRHGLPLGMQELLDAVRSRPQLPVYNARLTYNQASLVYVKTGRWPQSVVEKEPVGRDAIPPGAMMLYDLTPGRAGTPPRPVPDPRDESLMRTEGFAIDIRR